jgi:hypothetical protein
MKKIFILLLITAVVATLNSPVAAQCSVCTKTAMQLGEKPAQGLNQGILYLMFTPFLIVGFIGFRWWKTNKQYEDQETMGSTGNSQ